jgi:FkbM family methyltransferase
MSAFSYDTKAAEQVPALLENDATAPQLQRVLTTAAESDLKTGLHNLKTVVYVMHMKSSLKRATKKALAALGLEVHSTSRPSETAPNYGLDNFFPLLCRLGLKPRRIIDVGANHGNWTRHAIRYFPSAAYTLIEPQANLKPHIQDLIDQGYKITWINAGCSSEPGQLQLMLSQRDDSSTFIQEDRYGKKITLPSIAVSVTTLNQIAATAGTPEMVKIDAEGYDLKVLEGASNLFGRTEIFLVEAQVCGPYDTTMARVVSFMEKVGYQPMDITDINRNPEHGVLWLCELAFIRKDSPLIGNVMSYE